MPRIISGEYGGLVIKTPRYALHPTSDRVKEYIFNVIKVWKGLTVVDLFAGSGSLGLEALSRGADAVDFVDNHALAISTITENLKILSPMDKTIRRFKANAQTFCTKYPHYYDRIFADPPYQLPLQDSFFLSVANALKSHGLFILEYSVHSHDKFFVPLTLLREKKFGETGVRIYEK
ncbi:MAG: 16S rRNA (guanine(966)-N(2))-methyltransferase RsmD [Candidatus Marinimicrobia bacterium]|nr:16S rRNA (guanine(966)-N(2))-methyltransferase RsmD [Candidatus Neomarinimicrobiota bacterium]